MSRMNGENHFKSGVAITPGTGAIVGDTAATNGFVKMYVAHQRTTVTEVGCIAIDSTHVPSAAFTFRVKKRTGALIANDIVVPVFKAAFAAQGGPGGDPSVSNFDNANQIPNGIITNTAAGLVGGTCLRAFCEVSLDKGDAIVFEVVANGGALSVVNFYANGHLDGSGLIEANDRDSN